MKEKDLIKTINVKGREFDYIPQFNIVGYENEAEDIDIIVKNIYNEEQARIYAKKALEVLESGMIEFTSKYHQFHLTKEELKEFNI